MINKKFTLFFLFDILFFLSFYYYQISYSISYDNLMFIIFLAFLTYIVFFLTKEENVLVKKQYFSITRLFIIGYTIVFFQNYLDLLLGLSDWDHYLYIAYPNAVCKSAIISLSGFVCFCIGYLLYRNTYNGEQMPKKVYTPLRALKLLTLIMFVIFASVIDKNYINGGYADIEIVGSLGFVGYFFEALLYAVIILYSINCSAGTVKKGSVFLYIKGLGWFNIIIGAYLLMVLLSGDRGAIIYFILAYSFSYICYSKKTFRGKYFFTLVFIGGFILTTLGVARNIKDSKGNKLEQIDIALQILGEKEKTSFFLPTKELANSVRTLHAVVENSMTKSDSYFYGKYQLSQILSSFPFMGTLLVKSGIYTETTLNSSAYITSLLQGAYPRYGDGSSCNADLYLDFGYWGVCIGLFFFGLFCRKADIMECELRPTTLFFYVLMIVYFSYSISITRNPILSPLKRAILVYLICVSYNFFVKYIPYNGKS